MAKCNKVGDEVGSALGKKIMGGVLGLLLWQNVAGAQTAQDIETAIQQNRLVLVSDYDGTLTGQAWNTPWVLKKIHAPNGYFDLIAPRTNIHQADFHFDQLPDEILISEKEYYNQIKNKLAVTETSGKITVRTHEVLELEPLPLPGRESRVLIFPGFYRVTSESFVYFRSQKERQLLLDNEAANKIVEQVGGGISKFGISFPLVQRLLQDKENVSNLHILTARSQSPHEFMEDVFKVWQQEGHIKYVEGDEIQTRAGPRLAQPQIHPLGRGEGILFGTDLPEKKKRFLHDAIIPQYSLMNPKSSGKWFLVVAEDRPEILFEFNKLFIELTSVSNYRQKFEFILIAASSDADLKRSELPSRVVTYNQGFAEAASAEVANLLLNPQKITLSANAAQKNQKNTAHRGVVAARVLRCLSLFKKGQNQ